MKLFAVYPARVLSINDFEYHHVSAQELMSLYKVDPRGCIVFDYDRGWGFQGYTDEFIYSLMPLTVKVGHPGVDYSPVSEDERQRLIESLYPKVK